MTNGERVVFRGDADQSPGIEPGDVVVVLDCKDHPKFTRKGNHLFVKKRISLLEALTGFKFNLRHLDGRVLSIESNPGTVYEHECFKVIRDEGMPMSQNPTLTGNLYIEFLVDFPSKLTPAAREALKKCLPAGEKGEEEPMDDAEEPEEVRMENVDMDQERKKFQAENRRSECVCDGACVRECVFYLLAKVESHIDRRRDN